MGQRLTKLEAMDEEALEHMRHGRYRQYRDALQRLLVARQLIAIPGAVQHALFDTSKERS